MPVADIPSHIVQRSHRRYGLNGDKVNPHVDAAWRSLVASSYAQDLNVQDGTGVAHVGSSEKWAWDKDGDPTPRFCLVWKAWNELLLASRYVEHGNEPYRYDLVNLGREILAQMTGPVGVAFLLAIKNNDTGAIKQTGAAYARILEDLDACGHRLCIPSRPWLEMAKALADSYGAEDCAFTGYETITTCAKFTSGMLVYS